MRVIAGIIPLKNKRVKAEKKLVTIDIKATMSEGDMANFLGMLDTIQNLGAVGSSRTIELWVDGDGASSPKFEYKINPPSLVEPIMTDESANGTFRFEMEGQ